MKARTVVGLTTLLLVSCRLPPATLSEPANAAQVDPKLFVEAPPQRELEAAGDPPVPKLTAGDCPPEVTDYPEIYFGERLLIRLPRPVSSSDLVELSPERAQLFAPVMLPTCKDNRPTVALEQMILELQDPDSGAPLELVRNDVLSAHGLLDHATLIEAEVDAQRRHGAWVFDLPTSRLLVTIAGGGGDRLAIAIYQVAAGNWSLVVNSLRESSRRISLLRN